MAAAAPSPTGLTHAEAEAALQSGSSATKPFERKKLVPPKGWHHFVAGGVGGMCGAIITSPLDVVKTRLQSDLFPEKGSRVAGATGSSSKAPGFMHSTKRLAYHFVETGHILRDIATKEGPRALFKGLGPTLVGVVPARSINFYTYGNGKRVIAEFFNDGNETPLVHLSAATFAGIVTATATNPIWVVKTRLQLETHAAKAAADSSRAAAVRSSVSSSSKSALSPPSRSLSTSTWRPASNTANAFFRPVPSPTHPASSSFAMTLRIVKQEGIAGLYKGMSASYLGVAEGTIQWVLYERLKTISRPRFSDASSSQAPPGMLSNFANTIGAAGTAKLVASLITYPHEVIRTRLRQQPPPGQKQRYTGLVQTFRLVLREQGAAGLYGGLSAHLLRVVPNAAVMFCIYELWLGHFGTDQTVPAPTHEGEINEHR